MKKILLLLAGGLLIACMAGSAMALGLDILDGPHMTSQSILGDSIYIGHDENKNLYLKVITDSTESGLTDFPVTIKRLDPVTKEVSTTLPINLVQSPDNFSIDLTRSNSPGVVSADPVSLHLISGAQTGELYRVTVKNEDCEVLVTTTVQTAPVFPIVALPVASVLGLIFVFGRKKGDM